VLISFDNYSEWNPFHRKIEVVQQSDKRMAVRMTVDMGPRLGTIISEETIYYCDERRKIICYGIGKEGASCFRAVWLTEDGHSTTINSYDMIGGIPALFSYGHIEKMVKEGFNAQHLAIKAKAMEMERPARRRQRRWQNQHLGVCLVTGGCGLLGRHVIYTLSSLVESGLVEQIHCVDINEEVPDLISGDKNVIFHIGGRGDITDRAVLEGIFKKHDIDTIFHLASVIDLRPVPSKALLAVNVCGTKNLLDFARLGNADRFVYTSSIECSYRYNFCDDARESDPPSPHPCNLYQKFKIDVEREVLDNNSDDLATVVIRPSHILGNETDDDLNTPISSVNACFGEIKTVGSHRSSAKMGMVFVENCALAHVVSALRCPGVDGMVFNVTDFNENIVTAYRGMRGKKPPAVCLPFWVLWLLVYISLVIHNAIFFLSCGRAMVLDGKTGLHNGALAAGRTCTQNTDEAKKWLDYPPGGWVTRSKAEMSRQRILTGSKLRNILGC